MRYLVVAFALIMGATPAFPQDAPRISPGIAPSLPHARPEVSEIQNSQQAVNAPQRTVKGEVLALEHDYLVVKERSGAEVRLPLNLNVPGERDLHVGDKIVAHMAPSGDVTMIHKGRPKYRSLEESSGGASGGERRRRASR